MNFIGRTFETQDPKLNFYKILIFYAREDERPHYRTEKVFHCKDFASFASQVCFT